MLLDSLVAAAEGTTTPTPLSGSAVEIAAGLWQRAFQMAEGGEPYFTPALMGQIARNLVRHGEAVLLIDPKAEALHPVIVVNVKGGPNEAGWSYPDRAYRAIGQRTVNRAGKPCAAYSLCVCA